MTTPREQQIHRNARHAILIFLHDNYPCQCGKEDYDQCPGEIEEAEALTQIVVDTIAADIWDEGENVGYVHGQHDAHHFDPGPDYAETPNPYRASGTA